MNLAIFLTFLLSKWMDSGYLVCASPPTVLYWFFWNFTGVLDMVWRYACGLDIILKLFFYHFFCYFNLGIFLAFLLSKLMDTGYLVCATPPTVLCRLVGRKTLSQQPNYRKWSVPGLDFNVGWVISLCKLTMSYQKVSLTNSGIWFKTMLEWLNSQFISKYSLLTVIFSHLNNKQ